jgi:hypothetical protein
MNENLSDPRGRLLDDVLQNQSYGSFSERLKRQALREVRQRHTVRRIAALSSLVSLVVAAAAFVTMYFRADSSHDGSAGTLMVATQAQKRGHEPARMETQIASSISDQELIATFPPDSCCLAEVDGRTVLVFIDPEVRKRFIH